MRITRTNRYRFLARSRIELNFSAMASIDASDAHPDAKRIRDENIACVLPTRGVRQQHSLTLRRIARRLRVRAGRPGCDELTELRRVPRAGIHPAMVCTR